MDDANVNYEFASKALASYYQEKYPDYCVTAKVSKQIRTSTDAWGWDDEYHVFSGEVIISKNEVIFDKTITLKETKYLDHEDVKKTLIKALQEKLGNDQYEIVSVYPTNKYVGINIIIKEKKLVKKVNNYEN